MNIAGGTPITATFEYDILLILKGACKKVSFKSPCRDIGILFVPFYYNVHSTGLLRHSSVLNLTF